MAPQYRGGHRRTSNFIQAGFLAADVDHGHALDEAQDHALVRHHAGLTHTTVSHTPKGTDFRIVFPPTSRSAARDWADAQLGLALMLGSDRSVSDGARLFFGNTGAIFFQHRSDDAADGRRRLDRSRPGRAGFTSHRSDGKPWPVNSVRRIAGPDLVKVAGGELLRVDELGVGVPVHCPHHDDDDPSAFTSRSGRVRSGSIVRPAR